MPKNDEQPFLEWLSGPASPVPHVGIEAPRGGDCPMCKKRDVTHRVTIGSSQRAVCGACAWTYRRTKGAVISVVARPVRPATRARAFTRPSPWIRRRGAGR
jgi:hypothetical protein